MKSVEQKRAREQRIVEQMISLYCRKNHKVGKGLCPGCRELCDYAKLRSQKCPFMENKTFCANCKVHCYKPEMREKNQKSYAVFWTKNNFVSSSDGMLAFNHKQERKEKVEGAKK